METLALVLKKVVHALSRVTWLGIPMGAMASALVPMQPQVQAQQTATAPIPEAAVVCAACHADTTASWAASLHRRTVGAAQIRPERQACEACHREASAHLADVTDVGKRPSLAKLTADEISDICQACHRGGKQALWELSAHAHSRESCLTCHSPHYGVGVSMLKAEEPELCRECHPAQVAEGLLPSHHPIREGKMVCTDCHNVHGDQRGESPEASIGEMCFRCHAERAGPFIAEHPPVTEDCTICHRPHGSPVDDLLIQNQPLTCLQCHAGHSDSRRTTLVGLTPDSPATLQAISAFYGRCTSCHSHIHGTDLLSGSRAGNPTYMPGRPLVPLGSGQFDATALSAASVDHNMWGFGEVQFSGISKADNPSFVREYDGRDYDVPTSRLSFLRYGQQDDFRFEVIDLPQGNQDIKLRLGNPSFDLQVAASSLTHRLGRFDEAVDRLIPGQNGGTARVNTTDLTGGKNDYRIERTVVDARLAARCPRLPNVKLLLNYWQESEDGARQFLFLDRCISCHKIQVTEPIERVTTVTEGGIQVDFPRASLRYLRGQEEFGNQASEMLYFFQGTSSVFYGLAPLFGVATTETATHDLRGAGLLGRRTSASALWRTKDRDNRLGHGEIEIRSFGGGISHALSPHLKLRASRFQRDLEVSENLGGGVSRDRDITRVALRYLGLPGTVWSVGYAKEKVQRESKVTFVPRESDSDIWTSAFTFQPISRWSLRLRYRKTRTDQKEFLPPGTSSEDFLPARLIGLPTDGSLLSGVLTYGLGRDTQLSGIYSRRRDSFEAQAPELGILRSSEETTKTKGAQLVHARRRAQLSAGYYRQDGDTSANTTYGTETFVLAPPLSASPTDFPPIQASAAYDYQASIATLNGSFWATSRLRFFTRYAQTKTDGREQLSRLGDYIDNNPDLDGATVIPNPFDIDIKDWWIGGGYRLDPKTEVVLSHQRRSWDDGASPSHDGSYRLWRVGLRREF